MCRNFRYISCVSNKNKLRTFIQMRLCLVGLVRLADDSTLRLLFFSPMMDHILIWKSQEEEWWLILPCAYYRVIRRHGVMKGRIGVSMHTWTIPTIYVHFELRLMRSHYNTMAINLMYPMEMKPCTLFAAIRSIHVTWTNMIYWILQANPFMVAILETTFSNSLFLNYNYFVRTSFNFVSTRPNQR